MRSEVILATLLGGGATYLIRLLPILAGDRPLPPRPWSRIGRRFLLALGPSAIAALLVLSLRDLLPAPGPAQIPVGLSLIAGAATVLLVQRLTRNPAVATLAGAATVAIFHAVAIS